MKACIKTSGAWALALFIAACATTPTATNPEPACYRPHWTIPFEIQKLNRVLQQSFTTHDGSERILTIFAPGPFERSLFFVMSPEPDEASVVQSLHTGIMLDSNRDGKPDCFILAGGKLPDPKGRPVPYNFFAIDWEGEGRIETFISEDLDLNGDRIMDPNTQAVLMEADPEGHFQMGAYMSNGTISPIPKEGSDFLLKKPLYPDGFHFPDNEVTQMTLFAALQKIWKEVQSDRH